MPIKILTPELQQKLESLKNINLGAMFRRQRRMAIMLTFVLVVTITYFVTLKTKKHLVLDTLYWEKQVTLAKSLLKESPSEKEVVDTLRRQAQSSQRLILLAQGRDPVQVAREYAQRMNIRLVSVAKEEAVSSHRGHTVVINARLVKTSTFKVEAEGGYKNLVRYFDTLYRVAPAFVSIDILKITTDKKDPGRLKIAAEIRFYTLVS